MKSWVHLGTSLDCVHSVAEQECGTGDKLLLTACEDGFLRCYDVWSRKPVRVCTYVRGSLLCTARTPIRRLFPLCTARTPIRRLLDPAVYIKNPHKETVGSH